LGAIEKDDLFGGVRAGGPHPSIDIGLRVDAQLVEHTVERDRRLFDLGDEGGVVCTSLVEPMKLPNAEVDHGGDSRQHEGVEGNPLWTEEEAEPGERRRAV